MKEFPDKQIELKITSIICQFKLVSFIHLFYCPYYHKAALEDFYFCLSFFTKSHTNQQLASLADSYITHYFKLFWKIPLMLYCEHLQHFAKEMYFLLHISTKV